MTFICNKNKHCRVTKGKDGIEMEEGHFPIHYSGAVNGAPPNTLAVNAGSKYIISYKSERYDLDVLAHHLIELWDSFFKDN